MKNKYGNELTKRLIAKIIKSTSIYMIVFTLIWIIARALCKTVIWQPYDTTYRILKFIENNNFAMAFLMLIGFIGIVTYHLEKTLGLMDAVVKASSSLVEENNTWIELPKELVEVEEKLNKVRVQANENNKKMKELEQRKNDLVIYLAHDIKTPLTSMIGYLSLLEESKDMPKKQREKYIQIALEKSYQLEDLINELFYITRFNAKNLTLHKEEINLNLMLEQIVDDFYPVLKKENKNLEIESQEKIILQADSEKLARVFNNVIKNAIAYSQEKSTIKIKIETENEEAKITIINKGNPISSSELNKIFEKFYRIEKARTTKTGNCGLGLAIAKEIVELHNGTITATSNKEETKFIIQIP